ncbi:VolA/Pla-1 family phospholipase [Echinimonas agarilytica]|uniref:Bacterial virulence factor lipase N-terminal domain-containing protein n=1 Tax=Echinimonas agarilytica TaxID=1215918 RepID=A0AA42B7Y4_9GAMM|nr:VolA/Pla-1 family phospholipase [Echinimonas agarilytica]MCM2679751.1 hypothetical protein [Echinimonas agarilytica]
MNNKVLTLAALGSIGLVGCGGDSLSDIAKDQEPAVPSSRILFDPAAGVVALPSDLLLLTTTDGSLDVPSDDPSDVTDPANALSALDGWGTAAPMSIDVSFPGASFGEFSVNQASAQQPGAVEVLEVILGNPLSADPDCTSVPTGLLCKVTGQLTYGIDFVSSADEDSILVVPLKPLKPKNSYLVATTTLVEDSSGRSILPSSSYELLRLDYQTQPLGTEEQRQLQAAVNSYEAGLAGAGIDVENVTYSMPFTTQSVTDVMGVARLVIAQSQPVFAPYIDTMMTSADVLTVMNGGALAPEIEAVASAAKVMTTSIPLPMMMDIATVDTCDLTDLVTTGVCDVLFSRWDAQGSSPVSVAGALTDGSLSQENFATQAFTQNPALTPEDLANPAKWVGLNINNDAGVPVDTEKHVTQYNPLPEIKGFQLANVVITIPDPAVVNALRAQQLGIPVASLPAEAQLTMPAQGWPVAIFGHGITGTKEMVNIAAGTLALQGLATIAIDLPMHGERSADLTGDGHYELTATNPRFGPQYANSSIFTYLNLSSLLSVRDTLRQSSADFLTVRAAITFSAMRDAAMLQQPLLDASNVTFFGHSMGAITGGNSVALANVPFVLPDGTASQNPFTINAAVLSVPAGGFGPMAGYSPEFGPLVKAGLTASDSFQEQLQAASGLTAEELELLQANDPDSYNVIVDQVYPPFLSAFMFAAQQAIDAGDPINFANLYGALGTPILLHEVVGNGADNLSDQVLPNSVAADGWPVSGTEPLIAALGLDGISSSVQNDAGVSGAVRFMYGHHSSLLDSSVVPGVAEDAAKNAMVTQMMQLQVAEFLSSNGTQVTFTDADTTLVVPAN